MQIELDEKTRDTLRAALTAWVEILRTSSDLGVTFNLDRIRRLLSMAQGTRIKKGGILQSEEVEHLMRQLIGAVKQQPPTNNFEAAYRPDAPNDLPKVRPVNCRQRLIEEGKPYPKSSCVVCGSILTPSWICQYEDKA